MFGLLSLQASCRGLQGRSRSILKVYASSLEASNANHAAWIGGSGSGLAQIISAATETSPARGISTSLSSLMAAQLKPVTPEEEKKLAHIRNIGERRLEDPSIAWYTAFFSGAAKGGGRGGAPHAACS